MSILTAFVAIVGVRIAWLGLDTWKRQNIWQKDTELARDILISVRHCSDEFRNLRSAWMDSSEMAAAAKTELDETERDDVSKMHLAAIIVRLRRLDDKMAQLFANILEADIVWSTTLEKHYIQLLRDII